MNSRKELQVALGPRFTIPEQDSGFAGTYVAWIEGAPEGSAPTHVVECWPEARDDAFDASLEEEAELLKRWPAPRTFSWWRGAVSKSLKLQLTADHSAQCTATR